MSMDKSVSQAPAAREGLGNGLFSSEDPIEILLIGEEGDEEPVAPEKDPPAFDINLAEDMAASDLQSLASLLTADYETDVQARKEWLETYVKGLKLLGLRIENVTEPWPGACAVNHPLLMESAVKFQSETIMETFPAMGPVKTKIIGKETPEKIAAATRVREDMNYELTEVMKEYRPEHERLLLSLCLSGNAFKKIYFDPALARQTAPFIPAEDIVVPYGAANIETAERVTHKMRKTKNELRRLQIAGFYLDVELGEPSKIMDDVEKQKAIETGFSATVDSRFQLLEMHVNVNLKGYEDKCKGKETGIELPYVVTIEKGTSTVLAIRRNWLEEDKLKYRRQHFVHYGYIPGFGFYYFGLIHLIGGHTEASTSLLRQLVDAGTLSNLPGGLKAKGLRIKEDNTPISPGEFRDVDLPSGTIRDNILPLPYKEPSQTLSMLMDKIVDDGRRYAGVADLKVSDMSSESPVGTTLAILERVLKVMTAVQARIHYTMKQEFRLLAEIIRDHTSEDYDYEPETGEAGAKKADYDSVDVLPVSDPNASTMSQRVVQYQAVLQLSQSAPQIYDLPFLHRQMIETLGVRNSNKIVPIEDDMKPSDPVSENMAVMNGKPVKAFITQDHEAHLAVHLTVMQDPKIQQAIGQNPNAQSIMGAAHAHVMEHVAFQYRREIEKHLGTALPPIPDDDEDVPELSPEITAQIAHLSAMAATKMLQQNQATAQQQQAQEQAKDPLIQMQQQDLQIRAADQKRKEGESMAKGQIATQEQARKEKQMMIDAAAKADELRIKDKQVEAQINTGKQDQLHKQHSLQVDASHKQDRLDLDTASKTDDMQMRQQQQTIDAAARADDIDLREADSHQQNQHHETQIASDHAKHASTLGFDRHKHNSTLEANKAQHEAQMAAQAKQAANKPTKPKEKK